MRKHKRMLNWTVLLVVLGVAMILSAPDVKAAHVKSGGSGPKAFSNVWKYSTPGPSDTITWSCGENTVDSISCSKVWAGPEQKFNCSFSPPRGRGFKGIYHLDSSASGGRARGKGWGSSSSWTDWLGGKDFGAYWQLQAEAWGHGYNYCRVAGKDPFCITPAKLSEMGVTGENFDLFFSAALESGSFRPGGAINFNVTYEDASGTTNLLSITIDGNDANGVNVTNDDPSGLKFYRLEEFEEGPTENPNNLTTIDDIEADLVNDVCDFAIDEPLYLGIVWEDIPVPTVDLGDGSVARIEIESEVSDECSNSLVVDDFQSYTCSYDLRETWYAGANYGDVNLYFETIEAHDGNSMKVVCDDTVGEVCCEPNDPNWTQAGVEALSVWFNGDPNLSQLYVKLADDMNNYALTDSNATPGVDVKSTSWQEMNLDLSRFTNVDLTDITQISLGIVPEPYCEVTVYFDDIRLYKARCFDSLAGDLNSDCIVDLKDFSVLADRWLETGMGCP